MYRLGYFRQHLNADGWQEERYPVLDPHSMALTLVDGRTCQRRPGRRAAGRPGLAGPGRPGQAVPARRRRRRQRRRPAQRHRPPLRRRHRAPDPPGDPARHRRRAGPRRASATETQVFHTNEGHAGFLGLERIRQLITNEGLTLRRGHRGGPGRHHLHHPHPGPGRHRPLPPGADGALLRPWAEECDVSIDTLMDLGHFPGEAPDAPFNMAVMGLRLAGMSNGVAKLHGQDQPRDVPGPVAGGAGRGGARSARSPTACTAGRGCPRRWTTSLRSTSSPAWDEAGASEWAGIDDARDDELWRVREQGREALVDFVRARLQASLCRPGVSRHRRGVGRRGPRPPVPDHRLLPPLRHLQAGHAAAVPARAAAGPAPRRAAAHPAGVRRQGPPGRRPGQGDDRRDRPLLPRSRACATASPSSRTTTSPWPGCSTRAATCG